MAKRFTDTNKYKKPFMRSLPMKYKLLWDYILCDCDQAGLWIADFEIAQIYLGKDAIIDKNEALNFFNKDESKVIPIKNSEYWFIPSFIEFQYGNKLSKTNNVYSSIEKILSKYNLFQFLTIDITEEGETKSSFRNRISKKIRQKIFLEDNLTCQYCNEQKEQDELVVDHIIPLENGGNNEDINLITSCIRCNSRKTDIDPEIFISKPFDFLNPSNKLKERIKILKAPFNNLNGGKDKDKAKEKEMDKDKEMYMEIDKDKERKFLSKIDESKLDEKEKNFYHITISFWELFKSNLTELNISTSSLEKADYEKWVSPIRLLIEKDKRTIEEIREVFLFIQHDDFWKEQIRSTTKLRKKNKDEITYFESLLIKSRNGQKRKQRSGEIGNSGVSEDYKRSILKRLQGSESE